MDIEKFTATFETYFPPSQHQTVSVHFEDVFTRSFFDPCFDVAGMTSVKKQFLLKFAFKCVDPGECYVEVGTYQGKSLISAVAGAEERPVYACDNFSEFQSTNSLDRLYHNLKHYDLASKIHVFNSDFRAILTPSRIPEPVGLYFYDGAHDEQSQYDAIRLIEPLLAARAVVIVDDWRFAADSRSYAREGTLRALRESKRSWQMLYDLPARFNGDQAMWWNGVAVFAVR
jgi:predicted O-methyltransferase YrrM